jgi:hypothetical protein
MTEHERTEQQPDEGEQGVDDLDVPERQQDDVVGGSGHSDVMPTESISLN